MKALIFILVAIFHVLGTCGFAKVTGVYTGVKGKVGNVVYAGWKGIQVLKTRTIPANPRTVAQAANRSVVSSLGSASKMLAIDWIRKFWNPFVSSKETGWGQYMKKNILAMNGTFAPANLILSHGSLEGAGNIAATYDSVAGTLACTFDDDCFLNGSTIDKVGLVAFETDSGEFVGFDFGSSTRGDDGGALSIPKGLTPAKINVFLCFYREDAEGDVEIVSTSQHVIPTAV